MSVTHSAESEHALCACAGTEDCRAAGLPASQCRYKRGKPFKVLLGWTSQSIADALREYKEETGRRPGGGTSGQKVGRMTPDPLCAGSEHTYEYRACADDVRGILPDTSEPFATEDEALQELRDMLQADPPYDNGWIERRVCTDWEPLES